jgi:FkbM family methyltransferase
MHLAKRFTSVYAFEPVTAFRRCFIRNTAHLQNIVLFPYALGAQKREHVAMKIDPADSGGTHVGSEAGDIQMVQLDSIDYPAMVDCIKIDCEGYELEILKGARRTLEQFRPTVIVEQKPHKLGPNFGIKGTPAVDYLIAMGGSVRKEIGGDYILGF